MSDSADRKWVAEAKCLQNHVPCDYFYPEDGSGANTVEARKFCNGEAYGEKCPVKWECLHYALVEKERDGVWGGYGEKDRRPLARYFRSPEHPSIEDLQAIVARRRPAG